MIWVLEKLLLDLVLWFVLVRVEVEIESSILGKFFKYGENYNVLCYWMEFFCLDLRFFERGE